MPLSMSANKPYWWQCLIPRYGNWGGVGWSAGRWNNDPTLTDWSIPAIDAMDELFKVHDWAYQNGIDLDKADRELVAGLWCLSISGFRENLYRAGAIVVFSVWPFIRFI